MLQTGQGITVSLSLAVKCLTGTANSFWIIKLACWFQRRKFPQIVLQSVCRFRVIFERRLLLLSRCPSNLCAGSAFSPAAGQLQFRSAEKKQIENEQKLIMAHSGSPTLTWHCCYRLDWAQGSDALIIFAMQCFLTFSSFPQWKYLLIGHHWFSWECLDFNRILLIFLNGLSSTWF